MSSASPDRPSLRTTIASPGRTLVERIKVNGVELCVETFGDPADPPVLLASLSHLLVHQTSAHGRVLCARS